MKKNLEHLLISLFLYNEIRQRVVISLLVAIHFVVYGLTRANKFDNKRVKEWSYGESTYLHLRYPKRERSILYRTQMLIFESKLCSTTITDKLVFEVVVAVVNKLFSYLLSSFPWSNKVYNTLFAEGQRLWFQLGLPSTM